jgi:hypothetical protein
MASNPSRLGVSSPSAPPRTGGGKKGGEEEEEETPEGATDAHTTAGAGGRPWSPHLDAVFPLLPLSAPPTSSSHVEPFFTATFIF